MKFIDFNILTLNIYEKKILSHTTKSIMIFDIFFSMVGKFYFIYYNKLYLSTQSYIKFLKYEPSRNIVHN